MNTHDDNPYGAPSSVAVETAPAGLLVDAGKWRRFGNLIVDYLAIMALVFVAAIAAAVFGSGDALYWLEDLNGWQEQLLGMAVMLAYYVVMEGLFGATVGKWITRTRVVDERGLPPGWRTALWRGLARFIPFEPLSVLLADDDDPRGWHDRLPKTRVVLRRPGQRPASAAA